MNYYKARQRLGDKKFEFTCRNGEQTWPVGYCRKFRSYTPSEISEWHVPVEELARHQANESKYHDCGHDTEKEAEDCYRKYILDNRVRYTDDVADPPTMTKCKVCGKFTSGYAEIDHGEIYSLCKEHRNRETLDKILPPVRWIQSSY